jgi:uncharacterized membrane protein required for colicin V production
VGRVDWIILVVVVLTALGGYNRGLIGTALSFVGLVAGAVVGARVAPHFLSGGSHSQYTALVGLGGAFVGVALGRTAAAIVAKLVRGGLRLLPPLHLLDSLGGLVVGALWGLALAWVAGAVALQIHGHGNIHRDVRQSKILKRLDKIAPPHDVLRIPRELGSIASHLGE